MSQLCCGVSGWGLRLHRLLEPLGSCCPVCPLVLHWVALVSRYMRNRAGDVAVEGGQAE